MNGWHANSHAVTTFAAIAARAQPGHMAFFQESSLLAASGRHTSALIYADLRCEKRPCRHKDDTPRPMPKGSSPGLIWIDQSKDR